MSEISTDFRHHLSSDVTTLCTAWQLKLKDETVIGLTDHDAPFELNNIQFNPQQSLTETDRDYRLGFATDGGDVQTVFDLPQLSEAAVKSGALDDAELSRYAVNWRDPSQHVLTASGRIGNVKITEFGFVAEWVGHASRLDRSTGRVFAKLCDASFGDARCGMDASQYPDGTICPRTFAACRDQFSNTVNFRGFPYLLGDDVLQAAPQVAERRDGGSRYGHLKLNAS